MKVSEGSKVLVFFDVDASGTKFETISGKLLYHDGTVAVVKDETDYSHSVHLMEGDIVCVEVTGIDKK